MKTNEIYRQTNAGGHYFHYHFTSIGSSIGKVLNDGPHRLINTFTLSLFKKTGHICRLLATSSLRSWLLQYWPPACARKDRAERAFLHAGLRRCQFDSNVTSSEQLTGARRERTLKETFRSQMIGATVWSTVRFVTVSHFTWTMRISLDAC